jgi:hypothetical protein
MEKKQTKRRIRSRQIDGKEADKETEKNQTNRRKRSRQRDGKESDK